MRTLIEEARPWKKDQLLRDLVSTLVDAGYTRKDAEAEVAALIKWARETA